MVLQIFEFQDQFMIHAFLIKSTQFETNQFFYSAGISEN